MTDSTKNEKTTNTSNPNSLLEKYNQIQANEHHFNNIELEIRKLASVWLLTTLAAIAFIVRGAYVVDGGKSYLMMSPRSLIAIICCMGNLGLFVLWQLDQMVYHRLLNAVFLLGLRMEFLYKSLPPIRTLMILYTKTRGVARFQRWYYLIPIAVLTIISVAISMSIIVSPNDETGVYNSELPISISIASILIFFVAFIQSVRREKYFTLAKEFGDKAFEDYLNNEDYQQVLKNH